MPGRSAAQLERTPGQWHDWQAEERRRTLAALTAELARLRARGDAAIAWVDAGCPPLTEAEYEAAGGLYVKRRRGGRLRPSA